MPVEILRLELYRRLKQKTTPIYWAMFSFFSYGLVWLALAGGGPLRRFLGAGTESILVNAPYVIHTLILGLTVLSSFIAAAYFASAARGDISSNTQELLYVRQLNQTGYLGGRFMAAIGLWLILTGAIVTGAVLATVVPPISSPKLGPVAPSHFLLPFFTAILPFIIRTGLLYFGVAVLFQKTRAVTMVLLGQFTCYMTALSLLKMRMITLAALVDPTGLTASKLSWLTWTLPEKNRLPVFPTSLTWLNHGVWTAVGVAVMALAWHRFSFSLDTKRSETAFTSWQLPPGFHVAWFTFTAQVRSGPFLAVAGTGFLFMLLVGARTIGLAYDTPAIPVTSMVLDLTENLFMVFLFILTAWLAADLVWRERYHRVNELTGSSAISTASLVAGKLGALILIQSLLMGLIMIAGIVIQISQGYTHFEPGVYLLELFVLRLPLFVQLGILAFLIHSVVLNKLTGHLLVAVIYCLQDFLGDLGLEHLIWNYGYFVEQVHSAFNGFGPYLRRSLLFSSYWSAWAAVFCGGIVLALPRELDRSLKSRIHILINRLRKPVILWISASGLLVLITGAVAMIQTTNLHGFEHSTVTHQRQAEFERLFKQFENLPHPTITDLSLAIDLFPTRHRYRSAGTMKLQNKTSQPIDRIMIQCPHGSTVETLNLQPEPTNLVRYRQHNIVVAEWASPLAPDQELTLEYDVRRSIQGIPSRLLELDRKLVENGTFLDQRFLIPTVGYNYNNELQDETDRRAYHLPKKDGLLEPDAPGVRTRFFGSPNGGFVNVDVVISTDSDQTALAPGVLIRAWKQADRRYFHYEMPGKCLLYLGIVSARYAVQRRIWNDIPVEVYYHPDHGMNVETILDAAVDTLRYCSETFHPYPFGVLRIAEYPRYTVTAEAFPGLIPVSEGIGFIARKEPGKVDALARLIAHETAHQWFPHIIATAEARGMYFLTETLVQHVALKIMKQRHNSSEIKSFLDTQIQDYFHMRGRYGKQEAALCRTDFAYHVAYRKGMIVMNGLERLMGEDRLNAALKRYCDRFALSETGFAVSSDLIQEIYDHGPKQNQNLLWDFLEEVSWYDNRIVSAKLVRRPQVDEGNGNEERYVRCVLETRKFISACDGVNVAVPMDLPIEIAVLDEENEEILRYGHRVTDSEQVITIPLPAGSSEPVKVVLDPDDCYLDIDLNNQVATVTGDGSHHLNGYKIMISS